MINNNVSESGAESLHEIRDEPAVPGDAHASQSSCETGSDSPRPSNPLTSSGIASMLSPKCLEKPLVEPTCGNEARELRLVLCLLMFTGTNQARKLLMMLKASRLLILWFRRRTTTHHLKEIFKACQSPTIRIIGWRTRMKAISEPCRTLHLVQKNLWRLTIRMLWVLRKKKSCWAPLTNRQLTCQQKEKIQSKKTKISRFTMSH